MPSLPLALLAAVASSPASLEALAARFAPVVVQETRAQGPNRTQDLPVPFDFDGNWLATDNWEHQPAHAPRARPAVHWSAAATGRFVYLTYLLFYPRDWASLCLPFVCHENDLEQFTLVVDAGTGEPVLMDVKFHRGQKAYPRVDLRARPRDEARGRYTAVGDDEPRPLVRVEWGGHGILSCDADGDGRLDGACLRPESAWVLAPAGPPPERAEVPYPATASRPFPRAHAPEKGAESLDRSKDSGWRPPASSIPPDLAAGAERLGYDLVPLATTLWPRRAANHPTWAGRALAYVGRRLGRVGAPMGMAFAGSGPDGGARAPWGVRPKDGLEPGDRFLDPALAIGRRWRLPGGPDDGAYVAHPMLDDLRGECEGPACGR